MTNCRKALELARSLLVDIEGYSTDGTSITVIDAALASEPFEARAMQRMRDMDDAARFRWLCQNPDWHFIEMLCREFVAESADEFYRELSDVIDNYRATEASADKLRDRINAAMGGRQPTPL